MARDGAAPDGDPQVRAAGGVVWRRTGGGPVEVLLVHRPRYDDWSFPKGKVERADADELATARREVAEETGLECEVGPELAAIRYLDHKGRAKRVRFWTMRAISGEPTVNHEVDGFVWVSPERAGERVTYDTDRQVAAAFLARLGELH